MNYELKKRLTTFSRLWAVAMILFIVLCVVGTRAIINESYAIMVIAWIAAGLAGLILVSQVLASIVVRRWWCMTGGLFGVALSLVVAFCCVVVLTAGQYRPPKMTEDETVAVTDTVCYSASEDRLECSITAVVPPDSAVCREYGEWLSAQFGGSYKGSASSLQLMVDHYGKAHADTLRQTMSEGVPDYAELCYEAVTEKIYESYKVVTYGLTITIDFGGAHPVTIETGATFSKDDGKRLDWKAVDANGKRTLKGVMKDMLKRYFNATTDRELTGCLQGVGSVARIPLPHTPPYVTEGGLVFIYQQYEIAPYAAGMPCDTIPYDVVKPCLTAWARQKLENFP